MDTSNISKVAYPTYIHGFENTSFINQPIEKSQNNHFNEIPKILKPNSATDFSTPNGISHSRLYTRPAFNKCNESFPQLSKPNQSIVSFSRNIDESSSLVNGFPSETSHIDLSNDIIPKYDEREMPNLSRESDLDQRSSSLIGSSMFNQRYQNVKQFPNFKQRKKSAFERKLKRCGLELDGEVTISILRKFLQPFIYRDINVILDEYIEKYFLKAFDNIRENINITSENWSQILKCSISKSLYRQYCTDATIDPFDPVSTGLTDFPCFPSMCKIPNLSNQKPVRVPVESFIKSDIDGSTIPDIVSDTNSDYSNLSEHYGNSHNKCQPENHCIGNFIMCSDTDTEPEKKSKNMFRKRNIETNKQNNCSKTSNLVSNDKITPQKFSKSIDHNHDWVESINNIPSSNFNHFQVHNNYHNLSNNISENNFNEIQSKIAPFENRNPPFFENHLNSTSSLRNPTMGAKQIDYLNSSHNTVENNNSNNRYF